MTKKTKKITLKPESYWKLVELKTTLRCETWEDFANVLHDKFLEAAKRGRKFEF